MLVFIDESGDPGFKFTQGLSPVFVVAMVLIRSASTAEQLGAAIKQARIDSWHRREFKFNNCHPNTKDMFFQSVRGIDFSVRALIVEKEKIYSGNLRQNKDKFYNFFVKLLLEHDGDRLTGARIKIDGSGDRAFKQELNTYLRREVGGDKIKDVKFVDSKRNNLIQLADMCSGAVYRAQTEKKDANRWLLALRRANQIDNLWYFKQGRKRRP